MKIGEKEITIKKIWTRGDQKKYHEVLYEGAKIGESLEINMVSLDKANDFIVKTLTGLSDDEILLLSSDDFDGILTECLKVKEGKDSGSK